MAHTLDTDYRYPWADLPKPQSEEELKRRDNWLKLFMPSGAIVAGRTDQLHWLTVGTNDILPLMYSSQPLLMSDSRSQAVVRAGVYANDKAAKKTDEAKGNNSTGRWFTLPEGKTLNVRMSGLVWPEAQQRIANTAYLTRERVGKGQVILFSGQPNFRGSSRGTNRLLLNAIVYGPGLGSRYNIDL